MEQKSVGRMFRGKKRLEACLVYVSPGRQSTIRSGYFGIPSSHIDVKIYFCSQGSRIFLRIVTEIVGHAFESVN